MDEQQRVVGQCENCGRDYSMLTELDGSGAVICPECGALSENWDTPDAPQMAPSVIAIHRDG